MIKLLLLAAILPGCAHVHTESFVGPSGEKMYNTTCHGNARTWTDCYKEAHRVCAGPYTILEKNTDTVLIPLNGNLHSMAKRYATFICGR